ncbi:hypothetical protein [Streptomyces sp. NPDC056949]|uniref:hypothetical protein n=1 Tax=Streptomyces sp. NPDC056949 TaxID=3345976 RepID=UPI0036263B05
MAQLPYGMEDFLHVDAGAFGFTGVDASSFGPAFRRAEKGPSTASKGGVIARTTTGEPAEADRPAGPHRAAGELGRGGPRRRPRAVPPF